MYKIPTFALRLEHGILKLKKRQEQDHLQDLIY